MSRLCPSWIDDTAKSHFSKLKSVVDESHYDLLAVYCQCLADYRAALIEKDTRQKKVMLDHVLKYSKELQLTPKAKKAKVSDEQSDDLDNFLNEANGQ